MKKNILFLLTFFLFLTSEAQVDLFFDFEGPGGGDCHCPTGDCPEEFTCKNDVSIVPPSAPLYLDGMQGCLTQVSPALPSGAHSGSGYLNFYAGSDVIYMQKGISIRECQLLEFCVWVSGPPASNTGHQNNTSNQSYIEMGYFPFVDVANNDFDFKFKTAQSPKITDGDGWTQYCYTMEVPPGYHRFGVKGGGSGAYSFWIDDFSVKTVTPTIDLGAGSDTVKICPGESLELNATLSTIPVDNSYPGLPDYLWQDGSTDSIFLVTEPGRYRVEARFGCYQTTNEIVVVLDSTQVDLGTQNISVCEGNNYSLDATQNSSAPDPNLAGLAAYSWQDGSTNSNLQIDKPGSYEVKVQYGSCYSTIERMEVKYDSIPDVNLGSDTTLCQGDVNETIYLDASQSPDRGKVDYVWDDGSTDAILFVDKPGNYQVEVKNNCGSDMDEIMVDYDFCFCNMFVPNTFTPDFNGFNDEFTANGYCHLDLASYALRVMNRWGEQVFYSTNVNSGWDGTYNGEKCPQGTYTYVIDYIFGDLAPEQRYGHVTLLR